MPKKYIGNRDPEQRSPRFSADEHWQISRACECPIDAKKGERCTRDIARCKSAVRKIIEIHNAKEKKIVSAESAKKAEKARVEALDSRAVRARVASIGKLGETNPGAAHAAEYRLYLEVFEAVATSRSTARCKALAEAALLAKKLPFPRWYV